MKAQDHLVPLLPSMFADVQCPTCRSADLQTLGCCFPGIHVLGKYACNTCKKGFLHDLPIGFAVDHPLAISEQGDLFGEVPGWEWISRPLINGYRNQDHGDVKIERIVYQASKNVILLNTLDYLYGHVLLKLYNASHYLEKEPEKGLILIVPRMFAWLIPDGVAEAWIVDLRLGQTPGWHVRMDEWVQGQLPSYDSIELGMGYAHPEFSGIDISSFTGVRPFPMERFTEEKPHITFVARQDRIWFSGPIMHLLYRVVRKAGLKDSLGRFWLRQQNRLMMRTMARIARSIPDAKFAVVGLGRVGKFPARVQDLRVTHMNEQVEVDWCKAYAKSQLVIGIHGSNMLLPTAHAAGCIEILPDDRFGNIVQDISVRYPDRMQLFLYRFVDEYASPRVVAKHARSMFKDFPVYFKDNKINVFDHE